MFSPCRSWHLAKQTKSARPRHTWWEAFTFQTMHWCKTAETEWIYTKAEICRGNCNQKNTTKTIGAIFLCFSDVQASTWMVRARCRYCQDENQTVHQICRRERFAHLYMYICIPINHSNACDIPTPNSACTLYTSTHERVSLPFPGTQPPSDEEFKEDLVELQTEEYAFSKPEADE